MKKICFIIPYFGKLPANFNFWLQSCSKNPSVDFLIFTNDTTPYNYPANVKIEIYSFNKFKMILQNFFDFPIKIDNPWRLSFFKPCYGEVFQNKLKDYDFWGYCDLDLMWGNIRGTITNNILEKFERIGNQGHCTIFKNNKEVNSRYKIIVPNKTNYIDVFSGEIDTSFDENGMDDIYNYIKIKYYKIPNYIHLEKFTPSFYSAKLPDDELFTNKCQIFVWNNGTLLKKYIHNDKIFENECIYIHFWCRPMKYIYKNSDQYIIYPDVMRPFTKPINKKIIKRYYKQNKLHFLIKMLWKNRKKLTYSKIRKNFTIFINRKKNISQRETHNL